MMQSNSSVHGQRETVVFVLQWAPSNQGGVTGVVQRLIEHWERQFGLKPILMVNAWDVRRLDVREDATYVRLDLLGAQDFVGFLKSAIAAPLLMLQMIRFFNKHRVGAVNFHYPGNTPLIIVLLKFLHLYKGKLVLSYHGTDVQVASNRIENSIRQYIFRSCDAIVACSNGLAKIISDTFEIPLDKILVVYNGVDGEVFHPTAPKVDGLDGKLPEKFIVSIGSYIPRKAHEITLAAFASIAENFPNMALCIAGADGPTREDLIKQVASFGLSSRVLFFVNLDAKSIAHLLSKADLLVQSSHAESFPLSLLEAGASGTAIVASNIAGHTEIVTDGETGALYEAGSVEGCARRISDMLSNPTNAKTMSNRLRAHVLSELSWEQCVRRYKRIFDA
jgi:glycosyltransferase involved in cell wall biosynthesis